MERLINSDSTVTQLWNPITLKNPEDGGDMLFETSVRTRATQYKVLEVIYNFYRRENVPEDSVLRPLIASLYGEADQQCFHGSTTVESFQPKEP
jgi:hypothetical protein